MKTQSLGWCQVIYTDLQHPISGFVFLYDHWVQVITREEADLGKAYPMWIPREHVSEIHECPEQNPTLGTKWNICTANVHGSPCIYDVVPGHDLCALHLKLGSVR